MQFSIFEDGIKGIVGELFKGITDEIKFIVNNRILEYQSEEYNRNLYTKTLLHRAQPKKLFDFYIPLHIVDPEKSRLRPQPRRKDRISTDSIENLFKLASNITIIGSAGSGKSTIVKYLFINCIQTLFKIPVKIELRYLNDFEGSLIDYVVSNVFKINKLADNDRIIDRLLLSGKFVFFLDGYDEVNSAKREKVTKEIDDLVKVYSKNNFLLTSRPYTNIDLLPTFHNFFVSDLIDEEIDEFVKKQLPANEEELTEKIIEAIHNEENRSFRSFLRNPLLLSMFILSFQSYANIPQKRSTFYKQVFDALFSLHDSMSKLAFVREKQSGLSKEKIEEVLALFSFISFFEEKFVFSSSYFNEKLTQIKDRKKHIDFDNEKLIQDLQVAIGIINKEGLEYTFPHRSLQEFFAVDYISNLNAKNKELIYSKILVRINEEIFFFLERNNFYYLLLEEDFVDFTKFVTIPLVNKITIDASTAIESSNEVLAYTVYGRTRILQRICGENFKIATDYFCNEGHIPYVFWGRPPEDSENLRSHLEKHFERFRGRREETTSEEFNFTADEYFLAINNRLQEFIKKSPDLLIELEQRVIEDDESDAEIIDLI